MHTKNKVYLNANLNSFIKDNKRKNQNNSNSNIINTNDKIVYSITKEKIKFT